MSDSGGDRRTSAVGGHARMVAVPPADDPAADAAPTAAREHPASPAAPIPPPELLDELAALGALGTMSGAARSTRDIAVGALEILRRATAAASGLILFEHAGEFEVAASFGLGESFLAHLRGMLASSSPLVAAMRDAGEPLVLDFESAPLQPEMRAEARAAGLTSIAVVGLRVSGSMVGSLGLGYGQGPQTPVPTQLLLQAAALVAVNLQNARLVERLEHIVAAERRASEEQAALASLTQLADMASGLAGLADATLEQVVAFLRADGGAYGLLGPDDRLVHIGHLGVDRALIDHFAEIAASGMTPVRRFLAGEGPYFQPVVPGGVRPATLALAQERGFTAYASLPIRVADRLEGFVTVWFRRPVESIPWTDQTVAAISRILSISLANFRLREDLVASQEEYRTLFRESPIALVVQNDRGEMVSANEAALALYRTDFPGLVRLGQQRRRDDGEVAWERRAQLVRSLGTAVFRQTAQRADGSTFPEELHVARLALRGVPRFLIFVRDLTEQERVQGERLAAQKMDAVGQLVSGLAHELNNPLASIVAFSQLLRDDDRLPGDLREDATLLAQEADRTGRIVSNLLDFARQRPPERVTVGVAPLVQSVLGLQSYGLARARIHVDVDVPPGLPMIDIDRGQLQQVLLNLTNNAIQAIQGTGAEGTIRIAARSATGVEGRPTLRLSITDDGPGISPEARQHLFVPFFTTREPGEGSGLGLAVSFGIVAAHGGRLWFEPGPGGVGSTFTLELSATPGSTAQPGAGTGRAETPDEREAAGAAETQGDPKPSDDGEARPTVLVIDDEPAIRTFLSKALSMSGFDATVVGRGAEALDIVRERDFDAVLVDHRMPSMAGTEVYERATGIRPELANRFVMMSGDTETPELRDFAAARGIALLAKPFDVKSVVRLVGEVVGQARTRG